MGYLLDSMKEVLDLLIVVINGPIQEQGLSVLKEYTNRIYIRENTGYDGGAYKDAILNLIPEHELQKYDELVLFNDTFYGPLFGSWKPIFKRFEEIETDFWGLSKWLPGFVYMPEYSYIPAHVQAYFLVIRKCMLINECFYTFWRQLVSPMSYKEAVYNFEVGFSVYFRNHNFQYKTWIEVSGGDVYLKPGEAVYIAHAGDLVMQSGFPVIKKKAIFLTNFTQAFKALDYVRKYSLYHADWIEAEIVRYEHSSFPYLNIEEFYHRHNNIYIFGYGKWGRGLESYFSYKGWKIKSFVVTRREPDAPHLMELDELKLNDKDGLIVALGREQRKQIVPLLIKRLNDKDILLPEER